MKRGVISLAGALLAQAATFIMAGAATPLVDRPQAPPPKPRVRETRERPKVAKVKVRSTDHDETRMLLAANKRKLKAARQAKGMRHG